MQHRLMPSTARSLDGRWMRVRTSGPRHGTSPSEAQPKTRLWLKLTRFALGAAVSLATIGMMLLYESRLKAIELKLQDRNFERLSQTPLAFRSSVQVEPYSGSAYRLVTFNYEFQNVGADRLAVRQVVVRALLHKAVSLAGNAVALQAPSLERGGCLDAQDSWVEYAPPAVYDTRENTKISIAGNIHTASQQGGGLAELDAKEISGGSATYIVRATDDDFLGFLVCVEHLQATASKEGIIRPWKRAIMFRAKNMNWAYEGIKE